MVNEAEPAFMATEQTAKVWSKVLETGGQSSIQQPNVQWESEYTKKNDVAGSKTKTMS